MRLAGAEHQPAIGEDVQARAEHAAQDRVAVGTAGADRRETGNGFQVVGAIAGGTGWRGSFGLVTTVGELGATAVTTVGLSSAARATGAAASRTVRRWSHAGQGKNRVQPDIMIPVDQSARSPLASYKMSVQVLIEEGGTAARTGEYSLPGMALVRGCNQVAGGDDAAGAEWAGPGQGRAVEQQAAVAALFPHHMQLAVAAVAVMAVASVLMGSRHGHVHRHGHAVVVHRHRLGNQRADEDHPHGEQAQPSATGAPAVRAGGTAHAGRAGSWPAPVSCGQCACSCACGWFAGACFCTATSTVTSPAFSKCKVNGKRLPSTSRLRSLGCISITW